MKRVPLPILLHFQDPVLVERVWSNVSRGAPDDCWPWTGGIGNRRYGFVCTWRGGRKRFLAHRVVFTLATGREIGDLSLLHKCDNPPCCNPAHLRPGTHADNMQDAMTKGRMDTSGLALGRNRPPKTHCKWGHPYDDKNTYIAPNGVRACHTCVLKRVAAWKKRHRAALKAATPDGGGQR